MRKSALSPVPGSNPKRLMRVVRRSTVSVLAVLALVTARTGSAQKPGKEGEARQAADAKEAEETEESTTPINLMELPISVGGDARHIKIPYFDIEGNLKMRFEAEVATRTEEKRMDLDKLKVEIFDEEGNPDLQIEIPGAKLDLETHELESDQPVTITRKDFRISGEGMKFDSKQKKGWIKGKVKMVILNAEAIK
jgi:hypothetical protein